ncbi:MAG: zinc metalloprotease HtpX [Chitinophagales bacterium]
MLNQLKVTALMALLTGLLVWVGNSVFGAQGALTFFLLALGMNFFGYWHSDQIALRMTGSRPLAPAEAPDLHALVATLAARAGLPAPQLYLSDALQPNAFATGRNPKHSAIAVTTGLLHMLKRDELEGVLAHELAHIKNRDVLVGTIAAALAGAVSMLANLAQWGLFYGGARDDEERGPGSLVGTLLTVLLAPLAAVLIQMAVSRSREYQADATGAQFTGRPQSLANALLKLERGAQLRPMEVTPAAAHLFIVNPLSGGGLVNLFSTHPPTADRVRRLQVMRTA